VINLDVWSEILPVFAHYKQKTAAKLNAQQKAVGSVTSYGALRSSDNEQVRFSLRCHKLMMYSYIYKLNGQNYMVKK
jgi:hypothetical protein